MFQHTAARRRLHTFFHTFFIFFVVSTHSRPKAAAFFIHNFPNIVKSFNTQPPEGGCAPNLSVVIAPACFNTQPPEGGCKVRFKFLIPFLVSTHSRPKAAARYGSYYCARLFCFNTQPPEGGCFWATAPITATVIVSTHSRPKAAA